MWAFSQRIGTNYAVTKKSFPGSFLVSVKVSFDLAHSLGNLHVARFGIMKN